MKGLPTIPALQEGQLWRIRRVCYVRIADLKNSIVHFQLLRSPDEFGDRPLASGLDTLWRYLRSRNGQLVKVP